MNDRFQLLNLADYRESDAGASVQMQEVPRAPQLNTYDELHDPYSELKIRVVRSVIEDLGLSGIAKLNDEVDDALQQRVRDAALAGIVSDGTPLSNDERQHILAEVTDEMLAYGPITRFLNDDSVTEVMVNSYDAIYIERNGQIVRANVRFQDDDHVLRIIERIVAKVGRRIDESSPMVDARLPDGSRVNAIIPPLAISGPSLTIRRFRATPFSVEDLIGFGTLSPSAAQFLDFAVAGGANILISGGTGSGKTTLLNVMSGAIPARERIVTVEDAAELRLHQEHVISLESRPANIEGQGAILIRDLVRNSLRMRPDRIVVGECRGPEAVDMLQAMNTGHDGCMTTVHANTPRDAISRVETLVLTAGIDLPMRAIREQVTNAFDLVVQLQRLVDGTRRVTAISEITGMESDSITMQDIYDTRLPNNAREGQLIGPLAATGVVPSFLDKLAGNGVKVPSTLFRIGRDARGTTTLRARTDG